MQLKTLRQNSMTVTNFDAKFNQLTMQVDLYPMEEILYYLGSIQKRSVSSLSNPLYIIDIGSLNLAALHQDKIETHNNARMW